MYIYKIRINDFTQALNYIFLNWVIFWHKNNFLCLSIFMCKSWVTVKQTAIKKPFMEQSNVFVENTHICSLLQISFSFLQALSNTPLRLQCCGPQSTMQSNSTHSYLSELFSLCNWIYWDVVSPSASYVSLLCTFSWVLKSQSELSLIWSKSGKHIEIIWKIQKQKSVTDWKMHVCCVRKSSHPLVWKWVTYSGNEDIHSLSGWEYISDIIF